MKAKAQLPGDLLAALRKSNSLRIRAGSDPHRFIAIWFVLVGDRVFVRSWSVKPKGWYRVLQSQALGTVQVGELEVAVRAVGIRDKGLRDRIDGAYLKKYHSPGALKYAKDLASRKSRATTLELVPVEAKARKG